MLTSQIVIAELKDDAELKDSEAGDFFGG